MTAVARHTLLIIILIMIAVTIVYDWRVTFRTIDRLDVQPVTGAISSFDYRRAMSPAFHLHHMLTKYYDPDITLVTPPIENIENDSVRRFNYYWGINKRWQILTTILYPQKVVYKNYRYSLKETEVDYFLKHAQAKEELGSRIYFIFSPGTQKHIAVYLYKNGVFLVPVQI